MAFDGKRLRATRQAMREHGRPVSQQRFAELAGYSKRTQERYETGKSEPRMTHLREIVRLTGESQDFFYGGPSSSDRIAVAGDEDEEAASMPNFINHAALDEYLRARVFAVVHAFERQA